MVVKQSAAVLPAAGPAPIPQFAPIALPEQQPAHLDFGNMPWQAQPFQQPVLGQNQAAIPPLGHPSQVKERTECAMLPVGSVYRVDLPYVSVALPQAHTVAPTLAQIATVAAPPEKQWAAATPAYTCPWKYNLPVVTADRNPPAPATGQPDPLGAAGAWFGYPVASDASAGHFPVSVSTAYSCQAQTFPATPIAWLAAQPV